MPCRISAQIKSSQMAVALVTMDGVDGCHIGTVITQPVFCCNTARATGAVAPPHQMETRGDPHPD